MRNAPSTDGNQTPGPWRNDHGYLMPDEYYIEHVITANGKIVAATFSSPEAYDHKVAKANASLALLVEARKWMDGDMMNDPWEKKFCERIFPHNPKSCSAKYTLAKRALGIVGLRLHDNRRHAISGLFEQGFNVPEVQKVSLHKNPTILLKTYVALKPEDLHRGPASKRTDAQL
jgi:hypothetical protein